MTAPAKLGPASSSLARSAMVPDVELSIVMPCLNEAATVAICVRKAVRFMIDHRIVGEVIVADNGSTDGSQVLANAAGARVVGVAHRGYGAALRGGIEAARGRYVVIGDADNSYDFAALGGFVEALRDGGELVMGNRFAGGIAPGAMPSLHRWLGNPLLSALGRLTTGSAVGDFHCGLRGFRREAIRALALRADGMEFASEMVVKAALGGLDVREVPTTLSPDGRRRAPHLNTWRDGWRHLKFLLTWAPKWLFVMPGAALAALGLAGVGRLAIAPAALGGVELGVHTQLFAAMAVLLGSQLVGFGLLARIHGVVCGRWPAGRGSRAFQRHFTVERGILAGAALALAGLTVAGLLLSRWAQTGFGAQNPAELMRLAIPAVLATCLGLQAVMTSFFVGLLDEQ